MSTLAKGLGYSMMGLALLVPVGIALLAVGIPLIVVGSVLMAAFAVVAAVVALPVLIVGAVLLGLVAAVFGTFAALLGLTFLALKLTLIVVLAVLGLQFLGRMVMGKPAPRPELSEPAPDRYQREAERELNQELGM